MKTPFSQEFGQAIGIQAIWDDSLRMRRNRFWFRESAALFRERPRLASCSGSFPEGG